MKIVLDFKDGKNELPEEDVDILYMVTETNNISIGWFVSVGYFCGKEYKNYIWESGVAYGEDSGPVIGVDNVLWCYQP